MFQGKGSRWKEDKRHFLFSETFPEYLSSSSWLLLLLLLLLSLSCWSFVVPCICQAARWLIPVPQGMKQPSSGITDVRFHVAKIGIEQNWTWKLFFFRFYAFGFLNFAASFLAASAVSRSAGDVVPILLTILLLCISFSCSADQQSLERNLSVEKLCFGFLQLCFFDLCWSCIWMCYIDTFGPALLTCIKQILKFASKVVGCICILCFFQRVAEQWSTTPPQHSTSSFLSEQETER